VKPKENVMRAIHGRAEPRKRPGEQALRATQHAFWIIALLTAAAGPSHAEELTLEDAFAKTAHFQGDTYRAARNLLERRGQKLVPFLKDKTKSTHWQERDFARAMLLRLEQPELAKIYLRLQSRHNHIVTLRDDGKVSVSWGRDPKQENRQPEPDAVLDSQSVPLLMEMFREMSDDGNRSDYKAGWERGLKIAGHFAAAEMAPGLVHWYAMHWHGHERIPDVLVKIGRPALPWLREVIHKGQWSAGPNALRVVVRIGHPDEAVTALLLEKLKATKADHMTEPCALALGQLKIRDAMPLIWTQLKAKVDRTRRDSSDSHGPMYVGLRNALLTFGKDAALFLKDKLNDKTPLGERVMAGGLLYELAQPEQAAAFYRLLEEAAKEEYWRHGAGFWESATRHSRWYDADPAGEDDIPAPLLLERAYVHGLVPDLRELSRRKNLPLAYDVVADAVGELTFASNYSAAMMILARFHDERSIAVFRKLFDGPENYFVIRALPETLLEQGSAKGVAILEELLARAVKEGPKGESYRPVAELAKTILPVLKGEREHVVKLLQHEMPSVRETAAMYLAARNDPHALPVLLRQAAGVTPKEVLGFQGKTDISPQHVSLRDAIVHFGKAAIPLLEKTQKDTTNWRLRLLCESCILRIQEPTLAASFQKTAIAANSAVSMMMIPDYHRGGAIVAGAIGKKGLPLIESALAFNTDFFAPSAVYALGTLKEDRSIPVIVQSMPYLYEYARRDEKVGPNALHMFGEKGIEAAKKIPPPDPKKANFAERVMRHQDVTEALAFEKEIKGIDNLLDGFKLPRPAKDSADFAPWMQRMHAYLRISHSYYDKRLFEPMLALTTIGAKELEMAALFALKDYKDQRVVDRAVPYLGKTHKDHYYADPMVTVLAHQLGADIGPFLVKRLGTGTPESRTEAAYALGDFASQPHTHWRDRKDQENMAEAVKALRQTAVEPMRLALDDKNEAVSAAAAHNLVKVDDRSEAVARSLAAWLTRQKEPPAEVIYFLRFSNDPVVLDAYVTIYHRPWKGSPWNLRQSVVQQLAAGKDPKIGLVLLKLYRAGPDADLAWAMGELKITDAINDLSDTVRRLAPGRSSSYGRYVELEALCRLGEAGRAKVLNLFKNGDTNLRVEAARELAYSTPPPNFFKDVVPLWDKLVAEPPPADNQPHYQYRHHFDTLLDIMVRLDEKQAYASFCKSLLKLRDAQSRQVLATRILRMEAATPALRNKD
jgi:HEAT repeat protein